ncbi:protein FATTY ACID EXPORT 3, chloroplastic [Selaginella moellendorffii]|uniref:protein FATTY ACID EXPORT 3, chloroplastic n=1 Tax=Selaginella moellendorffii TaxID=88036 RepID=UPI000D1C6E98|nr:protein FATTY ACID EXPORT 3, chloroplastic [Selaginella moellendorffii]|eukprot:XP_024528688.1 protein FATTY ACID EXPORT 3, chloroplastic [Selaginella moellendorffii]
MMAAAAAATVVAPPNVVLRSCSLSSRGAGTAAASYPRLRFNPLAVTPSPQFLSRRNIIARQQQFIFSSSSVEDAASVNTKVDDSSQEKISSDDLDTSVKNVEVAARDLDEQAEKSKAVLEEVVQNLKDVGKLQDTSKQVYAESAEKAMGVLRDTTEQLREQAEKARAVLLATAQETAGKGKENLTMLAESSSDPVLKDIAETALNAHFVETSKKAAKIHDFCLGIPYGSILLGGGILWFLLTGSTAALRFGVFLGAVVLALSITSLKVWKRGGSSASYIFGQGAIASLLVIRELRRFSEVRLFFPHAVMALLSAAMLAFYTYVYVSGGNPPPKKLKLEPSGKAA